MKKQLFYLLIPIFVFSSDWSEDTNLFSFNLAHELTGSNTVFSPFSIKRCLSIPYLGSAGTTEEAMRQVLNITNESIPEPTLLQRLKKESLVCASSLWVSKDLDLLEDYHQVVHNHFDNSIYAIDYHRKEEAAERINQWAYHATNGLIPSLLEPSLLDTTTQVTILSTLYFKNSWARPFCKEKTRRLPFYTTTGEKPVDMMQTIDVLPFAENESWQSVALPLNPDESIAFIICLPKTENISPISPPDFEHLLQDMRHTQMILSLPKFTLSKKIHLNPLLKKLGMDIAYSQDADFSKMTGDHRLRLSDVLTETILSVDEEGLCAAAATAATMNCTCLPAINPVTLTFNHPFCFYLVDLPSRLILLQGEVWNP